MILSIFWNSEDQDIQNNMFATCFVCVQNSFLIWGKAINDK
jgi:hypothetical protein